MKIIFTGDNHVFHGDQHQSVREMMEAIRHEKPDVVCNVGDTGEVLIFKSDTVDNDLLLRDLSELFSIQPTLLVLGNHDLYSRNPQDPIISMNNFLDAVPYGVPLQKSWTDSTTTFEKDGCLFLGVIGFPDFSHPKLPMPPEYYDRRYPTVDGIYINLREGWLKYTNPLMEAFEKKLLLVDSSKCHNIIIITHYPIFEFQYRLNPNEEISVYFYCHEIGQQVRQVAQRNPNKNFYCVAGHGHEYCLGKWVMDGNIYSHGLVTTYHDQKYITLDIPSTIG